MGHSITAIIVKGEFDKTEAEAFDLIGTDLGFGLTLFHIDHYYSACWQYLLKTQGNLETTNIDSIVFPTETSIADILKKITGNREVQFAIIQTDYFGGIGNQYANVFTGTTNANNSIETINQALKYLGVMTKNGHDEFETVGLHQIREQPSFLEKYIEIADQYGV